MRSTNYSFIIISLAHHLIFLPSAINILLFNALIISCYSCYSMENTEVQTMYLSTLPNQKKSYIYNRSALDIDDIKGARSRYKEYPRNPREVFYDKNYDIDKSYSRQLIPPSINKSSNLLEVDDIQGTRTKVNKFTTTRQTNPLNPVYQIPKVEFYPVEQPKFTRDNLQIDDIEGVRTKETFANKMERAGKSIDNKKQLIMSIRPTKKGFERVKTTNNFSFDVSDINLKQYESGNIHKRTTDPLNPVYNVSGNKNYGYIQKSKYQPSKIAPHINNSLKTEDIEGAKPKYNNFVVQKKQEIAGCKASSLKKGVSSNRITNPLQPKYNYPGWTENSEIGRSHFTRPKTAHQKFDAFIK